MVCVGMTKVCKLLGYKINYRFLMMMGDDDDDDDE
jgi:hypothetical protein